MQTSLLIHLLYKKTWAKQWKRNKLPCQQNELGPERFEQAFSSRCVYVYIQYILCIYIANFEINNKLYTQCLKTISFYSSHNTTFLWRLLMLYVVLTHNWGGTRYHSCCTAPSPQYCVRSCRCSGPQPALTPCQALPLRYYKEKLEQFCCATLCAVLV